MNRNLSKRPKVVRRLDGALTAWRYFHGPNFVHEARRRKERWANAAQITTYDERDALFAILVAFVKWMQAPISPWAGSPFVEFVDETGTHRELRRPIVAPITFEIWDTIAGWDVAAFVGDRPIVDTFRGPLFSSKAVAFDFLLDRCFSEVPSLYAAVFDEALIECGGNLSQRAMLRRLA